MTTAVQDRLAARQQAAHTALVDRTSVAAQDLWLSTASPSRADLDRWATRHVSLVEGAARQAASLGQGYMDTYLLADGSVRLATTAPDLAALQEGIQRRTRSPGGRLMRLLGEGASESRAMSAAARYVSWLTIGDLQTAQLAGVDAGARAHGVTVKRWRKVPGPDACDWCLKVANNPFTSPSTVARHATCKCGVAAVEWVTERSGSALRYASRQEFARAIGLA